MPGKSHRKNKHLLRKKAIPTQTQEPVIPAKAAVASATALTRTAKPSVIPSLYISREIRTITLLAGIMLVLIVIVAVIAR